MENSIFQKSDSYSRNYSLNQFEKKENLYIVLEDSFFSKQVVEKYLKEGIILPDLKMDFSNIDLVKYFLFIEIRTIVNLVQTLKKLNEKVELNMNKNLILDESQICNKVFVDINNYRNFFYLLPDTKNPIKFDFWNLIGNKILLEKYKPNILLSSYCRTFKKSIFYYIDKYSQQNLKEKIEEAHEKNHKTYLYNNNKSNDNDSLSNGISIQKYHPSAEDIIKNLKFKSKFDNSKIDIDFHKLNEVDEVMNDWREEYKIKNPGFVYVYSHVNNIYDAFKLSN